MAQSLLRKTLAVFGLGGTTDDFEEFGSTAVAATNYTKDIPTIQQLSAWNTGWRAALVASKAPVLQDMNAVMYVHSYLEGYLFQEGIAEWDAGTTYNKGSIVKIPYGGAAGVTYLYLALTDANLNNALPTGAASNTNWGFLYGLSGSGLIIPGTADASSSAAGMVNEIQSASRVRSAASGLTTNVPLNVCSLTLSAGKWMLSAAAGFKTNMGTTLQVLESAISLTSATFPTGDSAAVPTAAGETIMRNQWGTTPIVASASDDQMLTFPPVFVNVSSSTTYYLVSQGSFTVSTLVAYGSLSARRV